MNEAGLAYLKWYYEANIWKKLQYRGVRTLKLPLDMWNYQELVFENDLHWVLETGTRHGGSALFFADLLEAGSREGCAQHRRDPRIAAPHGGLPSANEEEEYF